MDIQSGIFRINCGTSSTRGVVMKTAIRYLYVVGQIYPHHATVSVNLTLTIRKIAIFKLHPVGFLNIKTSPTTKLRIFIIAIACCVGHSKRNSGIFRTICMD